MIQIYTSQHPRNADLVKATVFFDEELRAYVWFGWGNVSMKPRVSMEGRDPDLIMPNGDSLLFNGIYPHRNGGTLDCADESVLSMCNFQVFVNTDMIDDANRLWTGAGRTFGVTNMADGDNWFIKICGVNGAVIDEQRIDIGFCLDFLDAVDVAQNHCPAGYSIVELAIEGS